ncbi:HWE histidine kinase domain-containing protein [Bradyrhizobium sp. LHD-71]|uniref:HWE histidine kinase domain-containing protein n=1 Tax=Bradyrhizobium sp. LHD-71 TaxID=3072141 RepID=UPI00280FBDD7|nr:HWE histidine kinase domain-containing protein [Bradyrhizobium sp. LHD-71]MDQ8727035.1 HWE histidine kinase domain-containing protein [Bradyrhizobium sp. LHD-71]
MVRLGFIVVLVALIGLLVSGLVALRVYEQEIVIEEAALSRAIETHGRRVQERLSERELLTRVAVGLIRSAQPLHPNALQPLRTSIYAFKTDFVLATWIANLTPADIGRAEQILAETGYPRPTIRNADDSPIRGNLPASFNVLMDVEPRTAETLGLAGRILDRAPPFGPAIAAALARRAPAASDPVLLPQSDGDAGILLAAPVFAENGGPLTGFISFSYRIGPLMLVNDEPSLFNVTLRDPRNESLEFSADRNGHVGAATAVPTRGSVPLLQGVTFGGRDFALSYYARVDPTARAQSLAAIVMIVGVALTSILCGLFGYVAYNNLRLSREIEARISFEARLSSVIAELNHRVKNVLAVIQSIVTRTMRPGADVEQARDMLIGRIHAMSHVISLLSDSHWQGARLKSLLVSRAIPHADRIVATGPDIIVSARAAQSLCLLFFELATQANAGTDGATLRITVHWQVTGKGQNELFQLKWEEFNVSAATRREDTDFGTILLDRVAPEALGGTSKRYFTDASYVFEISAPMRTVLDKTEMDRTGRLSGLLPPK